MKARAYILRHNNVDNYPSSCGKYEQKPTKEELVDTLYAFYDSEKSNRIADSLLAYGECDVGDRSSTVFTLEAE